MRERRIRAEKARRSPIADRLIGAYATVGGLLFFLLQTGKLFRREAAETEMAELPFGRFDWGFVWSDTLVAGPMLLLGGLLLFSRNGVTQRLGRLLAFTGMAINLYAIIFFLIGLSAVGHPITGGELWGNLAFTSLGVLAMIYLAVQTAREPGTVASEAASDREQ